MDIEEALTYVTEHHNDKPLFPEDWAALKTLAAEVRRRKELQVSDGGGVMDNVWVEITFDRGTYTYFWYVYGCEGYRFPDSGEELASGEAPDLESATIEASAAFKEALKS